MKSTTKRKLIYGRDHQPKWFLPYEGSTQQKRQARLKRWRTALKKEWTS